MSRKNDDFFVEKKAWSKVKDELLRCYLQPYMSKILYTGKPIVYVDCFAGKGKFDDGQLGSPLIAMDIITHALQSSTKGGNLAISPTFIDLHYANDLRENLKDYPKATIVSGAYEKTIDSLLKGKKGYNVFLYIDPYGIKALKCSRFDQFAKECFNSIELLINMNSFGFIREGCRVMGSSAKPKDEFFDDLVEYDTTVLNPSEKSVQALNDIAGGDYWKDIIRQFQNDKITAYQAEEYFSGQYCKRLSKSYRYVLNMPIRIKKRQHTKYRMIHATNHPAGCVLMADNICNRWELLKDIQENGQIPLIQEDINNDIVDKDKIRDRVIEHFSQYTKLTRLTEAEADFFVKYGAICKSSIITSILKKIEKEKRIEIHRHPAFTEKGKISSFMVEGHGKTISVRWVK